MHKLHKYYQHSEYSEARLIFHESADDCDDSCDAPASVEAKVEKATKRHYSKETKSFLDEFAKDLEGYDGFVTNFLRKFLPDLQNFLDKFVPGFFDRIGNIFDDFDEPEEEDKPILESEPEGEQLDWTTQNALLKEIANKDLSGKAEKLWQLHTALGEPPVAKEKMQKYHEANDEVLLVLAEEMKDAKERKVARFMKKEAAFYKDLSERVRRGDLPNPDLVEAEIAKFNKEAGDRPELLRINVEQTDADIAKIKDPQKRKQAAIAKLYRFWIQEYRKSFQDMSYGKPSKVGELALLEYKGYSHKDTMHRLTTCMDRFQEAHTAAKDKISDEDHAKNVAGLTTLRSKYVDGNLPESPLKLAAFRKEAAPLLNKKAPRKASDAEKAYYAELQHMLQIMHNYVEQNSKKAKAGTDVRIIAEANRAREARLVKERYPDAETEAALQGIMMEMEFLQHKLVTADGKSAAQRHQGIRTILLTATSTYVGKKKDPELLVTFAKEFRSGEKRDKLIQPEQTADNLVETTYFALVDRYLDITRDHLIMRQGKLAKSRIAQAIQDQSTYTSETFTSEDQGKMNKAFKAYYDIYLNPRSKHYGANLKDKYKKTTWGDYLAEQRQILNELIIKHEGSKDAQAIQSGLAILDKYLANRRRAQKVDLIPGSKAIPDPYKSLEEGAEAVDASDKATGAEAVAGGAKAKRSTARGSARIGNMGDEKTAEAQEADQQSGAAKPPAKRGGPSPRPRDTRTGGGASIGTLKRRKPEEIEAEVKRTGQPQIAEIAQLRGKTFDDELRFTLITPEGPEEPEEVLISTMNPGDDSRKLGLIVLDNLDYYFDLRTQKDGTTVFWELDSFQITKEDEMVMQFVNKDGQKQEKRMPLALLTKNLAENKKTGWSNSTKQIAGLPASASGINMQKRPPGINTETIEIGKKYDRQLDHSYVPSRHYGSVDYTIQMAGKSKESFITIDGKSYRITIVKIKDGGVQKELAIKSMTFRKEGDKTYIDCTHIHGRTYTTTLTGWAQDLRFLQLANKGYSGTGMEKRGQYAFGFELVDSVPAFADTRAAARSRTAHRSAPPSGTTVTEQPEAVAKKASIENYAELEGEHKDKVDFTYIGANGTRTPINIQLQTGAASESIMTIDGVKHYFFGRFDEDADNERDLEMTSITFNGDTITTEFADKDGATISSTFKLAELLSAITVVKAQPIANRKVEGIGDSNVKIDYIEPAAEEGESLAEREWKDLMVSLRYLLKSYPEFKVEVVEDGETNKTVEIVYESSTGSPKTRVSKSAKVQLPTQEGESPKFSMEGLENPKDWGPIIALVIKETKKEISEPTRQELAGFLGANKQEIAEKQSLDTVIEKLRANYTKGCLKLHVLVGYGTEIETGALTGGALGSAPLKLIVRKEGRETGIEISGGDIAEPIFYSLESDKRVPALTEEDTDDTETVTTGPGSSNLDQLKGQKLTDSFKFEYTNSNGRKVDCQIDMHVERGRTESWLTVNGMNYLIYAGGKRWVSSMEVKDNHILISYNKEVDGVQTDKLPLSAFYKELDTVSKNPFDSYGPVRMGESLSLMRYEGSYSLTRMKEIMGQEQTDELRHEFIRRGGREWTSYRLQMSKNGGHSYIEIGDQKFQIELEVGNDRSSFTSAKFTEKALTNEDMAGITLTRSNGHNYPLPIESWLDVIGKAEYLAEHGGIESPKVKHGAHVFHFTKVDEIPEPTEEAPDDNKPLRVYPGYDQVTEHTPQGYGISPEWKGAGKEYTQPGEEITVYHKDADTEAITPITIKLPEADKPMLLTYGNQKRALTATSGKQITSMRLYVDQRGVLQFEGKDEDNEKVDMYSLGLMLAYGIEALDDHEDINYKVEKLA